MLFALAALALTAQPTATPAAPAQPSEAAMTPPPAFITAAQAFSQCIRTAAGAVPASMTPEAGAAQALATCSTQKTAMQSQFDAWVAGPSFPEAAREPARAQLRQQLDAAPAAIAQQIAASRAAPAAPAAATPGH